MNNYNTDYYQANMTTDNIAYAEQNMPGTAMPQNMMQPIVPQSDAFAVQNVQASVPVQQDIGTGAGEQAVSPPPENEPVKVRTFAHPALVLFLMLVFFPAGIITMLFFTKWGGFAKTFITLFVLAAALALYEILVLYNVIDLPSVIGMITGAWNDFINI